jgi:hypothetical protein
MLFSNLLRSDLPLQQDYNSAKGSNQCEEFGYFQVTVTVPLLDCYVSYQIMSNLCRYIVFFKIASPLFHFYPFISNTITVIIYYLTGDYIVISRA